MQKEAVDAVLKHLKENSIKAFVDFPAAKFEDYTVIVTPVMFRERPLKGILEELRNEQSALITRVVGGAQVSVQIDIYARTTIRRDQLVDRVRALLKNFPPPMPEQPVKFLTISDARTLDDPEFYRTTMTAEFEVYDTVSESVPIAREIQGKLEEV